MAYPVTLNGRTYTLADFEGVNYVEGLPDAFEDFVTHAGDIYNDTSTTSNSIGTGSKTFTVSSGKPYQAGTPLRIADAAAPATNFLDAVVTSYSGTTLVVEAVGYGGSGTKTSWTVNIGGAKTIDGTLGVSQGGTGATTAAAARTNLDTYSKTEADSRFLNVSGEASNVTMTGNVTIGDAAGDTLSVPATASFSGGISGDVAFDTDTVFIDATNNRLGIGTTSVSDPLHIKSVDPAIRFEDSSAGITGYSRIFTDNNNALTLDVDAGNQRGSSAAIFKVDGTEHLRLDEYGQLILQSNPSTFFLGGTSTGSLVKGTSTGNYLIFGTSGAEVARFVGSNFGIGTTSPDLVGSTTSLTINSSGGNGQLSLMGNGTVYGRIFADNATGDLKMGNPTSNDVMFYTANAERLRITSGGSVGIGIDSPNTMLHVKSPSFTDSTIHIDSTSSNVSQRLDFRAAGTLTSRIYDDGTSFQVIAVANKSLRFKTNDTERARFDSSGNLLVGTTNANIRDSSSEEGMVYRNGHSLDINRSSSPPVIMNRLSSDGDIALFRKNAVDVGSIGSDAGVTIYMDGGGARAGIYMSGSGVLPRYNGALADNATDLGASNRRFKDLYLSGGVYLGGTGSANKLDDYEEGTWTPQLGGSSGNPTVSYSTQEGYYIKVGNLVTTWMRITISSISGGSGNANIYGLPFTQKNVTAMQANQGGMIDQVTSDCKQVSFQGDGNTTRYLIIKGGGSTGSHGGMSPAEFQASSDIRVCFTYQTT